MSGVKAPKEVHGRTYDGPAPCLKTIERAQACAYVRFFEDID